MQLTGFVYDAKTEEKCVFVVAKDNATVSLILDD